MENPPIWKLIEEAIENLNGSATYSEIKNHIYENWGTVNPASITKQIVVMTVNHKSRIHYPENHKPRKTDSGSPYDLLFATERGIVEKYNIENHGVWEIFKNEDGTLNIKRFDQKVAPKTFLFVWNPDKWQWKNLEENIEQLEMGNKVVEKWSCISHRNIKLGDRAFLARVGSEPRGIFASGYIVSEPFLSKHWSGTDKDIHRVQIDFDILLNPTKDPILTLELLKIGNLERQTWLPQSSGISVKPELVEELEGVWFDFLTTQKIRHNPYAVKNESSELKFIEGAACQIIQTRYERNPFARAECLKHYGYSCSVCSLNFEERFGEIGSNFIHVHHLIRIASFGEAHVIDPIKDLRPVCPNCHAMLHKKDPPLTIEELKSTIELHAQSAHFFGIEK